MNIHHEWNFGDDKEIADRLKRLVLSGEKKATTGLYCEGDAIPKVGEYAAISDADGKRFCIIRYTGVKVRYFLEVEFDFVEKEGEGDKDVEEWREKHRRFFNLKDDNIRVVCEEFEMVSKDKI